jgi:hypothetical protein
MMLLDIAMIVNSSCVKIAVKIFITRELEEDIF